MLGFGLHSPGLNNREWIETGKACLLAGNAVNSPGLNNREWIETSPELDNRQSQHIFSRFK